MAGLLGKRPNPRRRLRELLAESSPVIAPGVYDAMRRWGFRVVILPVSTLLASVSATRELLGRIAADGTPMNAFDDLGLPHLDEFFDLVGLGEVDDIAKRYPNG